MTFQIETLDWKKMNGLLPAVVQHVNGTVLMVAYMDQAALQQTLQTHLVTFYSRSKETLWIKGETSGNQLKLIDIYPDCDQDALLIIAEPLGPTCHQGSTSCFNSNAIINQTTLDKLEQIIAKRNQVRPANSYTSTLLNSGLDKICQKIGEESCEVIIAALNESPERLSQEIADLIFHLMVLLNKKNIALANMMAIIQNRME